MEIIAESTRKILQEQENLKNKKVKIEKELETKKNAIHEEIKLITNVDDVNEQLTKMYIFLLYN